MIKKRLILAIAFTVACCSCYYFYVPDLHRGSIITLHSYDDVDIDYDEKTLITFDVDDTLITAKDSSNLNYDLPLLFKILAVLRHPSLLLHYEDISSIVFAQSPRRLTELNVVALINKYKKQCKVVGLSAIESGSYGTIPSIPRWRDAMLKSMGINFSKFYNHTFYQLPVYRGTYPRLYKGVLYTNEQPKGKILGAFIDSLKKKPTSVISFDDQKEALYSIAQACKERNISCTGYHYIGATLHTKPLNYARAFRQLHALVKNRTLVIDKQI